MTNLDIWRWANILLKRYRGEAVFIAAKRADAFFEHGDVHGASAWVQVAGAIADQERGSPPVLAVPICSCGAPALYLVDRGSAGVSFVCEKHLPRDY